MVAKKASSQEELEPKLKAEKKRGWVWLVIIGLILIVAAGTYLLILLRSPEKSTLGSIQQAAFLEAQGFEDDRLIIPKIALNEPIYDGNANVLEKGLWHRFPERGNPSNDGNTILAGHRYVFAWLPQKVVQQSRFFNLDKLDMGDVIYINWHGKQFEYEVNEKKTVDPNNFSAEAPSFEPKLTLYTCTLNGQADGRVVIIARPKD